MTGIRPSSFGRRRMCSGDGCIRSIFYSNSRAVTVIFAENYSLRLSGNTRLEEQNATGIGHSQFRIG